MLPFEKHERGGAPCEICFPSFKYMFWTACNLFSRHAHQHRYIYHSRNQGCCAACTRPRPNVTPIPYTICKYPCSSIDLVPGVMLRFKTTSTDIPFPSPIAKKLTRQGYESRVPSGKNWHPKNPPCLLTSTRSSPPASNSSCLTQNGLYTFDRLITSSGRRCAREIRHR